MALVKPGAFPHTLTDIMQIYVSFLLTMSLKAINQGLSHKCILPLHFEHSYLDAIKPQSITYFIPCNSIIV